MQLKQGPFGIEVQPRWKVDGKPFPYASIVAPFFCVNISPYGLHLHFGRVPEAEAYPSH